jgi:hypothetical protein
MPDLLIPQTPLNPTTSNNKAARNKNTTVAVCRSKAITHHNKANTHHSKGTIRHSSRACIISSNRRQEVIMGTRD